MRCVQLVPFHSQVSPNVMFVLGFTPPNITTTPRAASYAIVVRRGDGPLVACNVQPVPFHSHVSLIGRLFNVRPPNATATPRAVSYAMAAPVRASGSGTKLQVGAHCAAARSQWIRAAANTSTIAVPR